MKTKWYGAKATRQLRAKLGANLDEAGEALRDLVRGEIGIVGPPRSAPGNPPHIDTGALIASYVHSTDTATLTTRVGSDKVYAVYLETGTSRMAPRPHLTNTFIAAGDGLARIVFQP